MMSFHYLYPQNYETLEIHSYDSLALNCFTQHVNSNFIHDTICTIFWHRGLFYGWNIKSYQRNILSTQELKFLELFYWLNPIRHCILISPVLRGQIPPPPPSLIFLWWGFLGVWWIHLQTIHNCIMASTQNHL